MANSIYENYIKFCVANDVAVKDRLLESEFNKQYELSIKESR